MTSIGHDPTHLLRLVEAARAHAAGLDAHAVVATLDEALRGVRALAAGRGDGPDEGKRPEELTTENDR